MEQIEAKSRTRLLIDNTEFPVQVKIPYDENLLTQEDQPRSIYLSAMSNELGLFIYAVGQRLMVINQEGLLSQFKATKDAGDSGQLDRPTLESMKSKGQLVTVALNKDLVKNEPITRILLEEEYTGKCGRLAIGFKSKVIIIETSSILSGNVDVVTSFDLPGKESLQTFSFVEKNMIAIDTAGKVHLVSGDLKISGLEGLKIADCRHRFI